MRDTLTLEQIQTHIRIAQDSVWVINTEIENMSKGEPADKTRKGHIQRNVDHLKIITTKQDIVDSGEDISALLTAIQVGEAKLAENIWPTE